MSGIKNAVSGIVDATVYYTKAGFAVDYLQPYSHRPRSSMIFESARVAGDINTCMTVVFQLTTS